MRIEIRLAELTPARACQNLFAVSAFSLIVLISSVAAAQSNPVPLINSPLLPTAIAPGSPGFTLTVNGSEFVPGSVVNWNGSPRTTNYFDSSQVTASISSSDIAVAGTASITVRNPAPGGGLSNSQSFPITTPRTTLSFSASTIAAGTEPSSARIADVNGDGFPDIIATNPDPNGPNPNTVGILLGNGDGTFRPEVDYSTGLYPNDVVIADFNGDGKLDLAVVNEDDLANSISILLGNGDGTFQPHVDFPVGFQPFALAAADLNGDGKLDLVVGSAGAETQNVSVLLGNGDGTFLPYSLYSAAGIQIFAVAVGDFNHDGILDVVTADVDANEVSLLLGKGDGTFQSHVDFPVVNGAFGLTVADFNGDGNLDLAVSNDNSSSISILLGNGNGTFQPQAQYATASYPFGVTTADVNGDGHLDLVVATEASLSGVSVLLGNGDGTFQPYLGYYSGGGDLIATGDFNNDGLIDFSVGNNGVTTLMQGSATVVQLSPSRLTFATQLAGTVSPGQTLTLTNSGATTVTISSMTLGTVNFGLANKCPGSLAAGKSCRVLVYFTPTTQGTLSDTLSIFDSGGGSPQFVPLSGSATVLSVSPKSLNFGSVSVGKTSPPQRVTLTNHGSSKVNITKISVTGADNRDFTEVNACGTTLGAGTSCTTDVFFSPKATGARSATLNITDTGGASPQTVSLSGTGQ